MSTWWMSHRATLPLLSDFELSHNADDLAEITPKWEAAATKLAELDAEE